MLLNLDAGEHPDEPEALWALADVLCCACGGHAGDTASMSRVAAFCAERARPQLGAHPSYPDREGFGRRTLAIEPGELAVTLAQQCRDLAAIARLFGIRSIGWVKPHGALYHDANRDPALAALVIAATTEVLDGVTVIGPPSGALHDAARVRGVPYLREGFADRATRTDGSLVPRSEPGALITDPAACARRARELRGTVDVLCVHGDTPDALAIATTIRAALEQP